MSEKLNAYKLEDVLKEEKEILQKRRAQMHKKGMDAADEETFEETKFGIALSGGGIRSATINLGFLKTLNLFKLLQKSDYLSTVSGGGYCGSYIQATLKERGSYEELFTQDDIKHLRSYGDYLIPGQSAFWKFWNTLVLSVGYFFSLMMSLLSPFIIIVSTILIFRLLGEFIGIGETSPDILYNPDETILMLALKWTIYAAIFIGLVHLVSNIFLKYQLGVSRKFNQAEAVVSLVLIVLFSIMFLDGFRPNQTAQIRIISDLLPFGEGFTNIAVANFIVLALLLISGFFLNPNALSFHRFYRNQLAEAFLYRAWRNRNMKLKDAFDAESKEKKDWINPYPLINTCLNLQSPGGGESFKGAKASDYFLLSPLFCGAKLVDYVKTKTFPGYDKMTLPAATTISAAAVNPGMGIYSNRILSIIMTIFNARLGFWVNNPIKRFRQSKYIVWWPFYFFYELFSKIGTNNRKLNISDGGHIENLAVYELLRRKCRLILAIDAGADPEFTFSDLENLTIRARNELGIAIQFREDPEMVIRPKPSHGYSQKRYVTADLYEIWEEFDVVDRDGNYFTYCQTKNGKSKDKNIEVLVNYKLDKDEKVIYTTDLKVSETVDIEISEETKEAAYKAARRMVRRKLAKRKGIGRDLLKIGTLVYIKSSVLAPNGKPFIARTEKKTTQFDTYKYKIYHPTFPHEPTSDQFFDPVQWEAYYQLGQYMAASVLGCKSSDLQKFMNCWDGNADPKDCKVPPNFSIENLIQWLDNGEDLYFDEPKEKQAEPAAEIVEEMILNPRDVEVEADFTEEGMEEKMITEEEVDYTLEGKIRAKAKKQSSKKQMPAPPKIDIIPDVDEEVDYEM